MFTYSLRTIIKILQYGAPPEQLGVFRALRSSRQVRYIRPLKFASWRQQSICTSLEHCKNNHSCQTHVQHTRSSKLLWLIDTMHGLTSHTFSQTNCTTCNYMRYLTLMKQIRRRHALRSSRRAQRMRPMNADRTR